jgi:hypothetical protein
LATFEPSTDVRYAAAFEGKADISHGRRFQQCQLIARRGDQVDRAGYAPQRGSYTICPTRRPITLRPSIQFRGLVVLALRERQWQSVNTRLQPREACIRLRLQISEHLPITDFDFAKNFIDLRERSLDKLNHFGDLTPQLLYIPLALFTATVEIAHAPPSYPTSS